jgi:diguanylate cyclase (GGDEF)-like protein
MCLRDALEIDHLRELMARDQLTGCLNRTGTFRAVSDEIARSRRHGHLLCVCFLDIDDFKRINDRYGHLVGDRVLREIGRALQATVRGYDLIGRIGGDEFLAVMPETDEAGATAAARRLVERIEAIHSIGEGADVEVSAKFGIARWRPGQDTDDLIRDADRVLLQRKAGARSD